MVNHAEFQHLGFATPNINATVAFYKDVLGFEVIHETCTPDGKTPIVFIKNGTMVYECYEDKSLSEQAAKKIDHIAYDSDDIEADYKYCIDKGYTITTNAIECIPTVFEKGVRYFKIAGPSGEEIEFCQILK